MEYSSLLDNTYYNSTLQFLLVEYYKCYKTQNELIYAIPNEFTVNDKEFVFTMNLLYGNAYTKKLIFKEILDLTIYNATFLKNLETANLMKTQRLEPNPRVEELSGGERQRCDMAFLLAVNDMLGAKMILLDEMMLCDYLINIEK